MRDRRVLCFFGALFLAVFILSVSGCSTLKGAADGFQEDWKVVKGWDAKFRENWW